MAPKPDETLPAESTRGPALGDYIETRFNLMTEAEKARAGAQHAALEAFMQATHASAIAVKAAFDAAIMAADLRYQQRFEAQSDALAAAFQSQQQAMQTAFTVAEKAVQAALAAADRAVAKAEAAADKRFEALNELRQMLNDMMGTLMPRTEAEGRLKAIAEKIDTGLLTMTKKVEDLEKRVNVAAGEDAGGRQKQGDNKSLIAVGLSMVAVLAALATLLLRVLAGP